MTKTARRLLGACLLLLPTLPAAAEAPAAPPVEAAAWLGLHHERHQALHVTGIDGQLQLRHRSAPVFPYLLGELRLAHLDGAAGGRVRSGALNLGFGVGYGDRRRMFFELALDVWELAINDLLRAGDEDSRGIDVDYAFTLGAAQRLGRRWQVGLYGRYNHLTGLRIRPVNAVFYGLRLSYRK